MIEDIKEMGKGFVSVVVQSVIHIFSYAQRHGTVGTQKAEKRNKQPAHTFICMFEVSFDG
jgi:hypothetical protein